MATIIDRRFSPSSDPAPQDQAPGVVPAAAEPACLPIVDHHEARALVDYLAREGTDANGKIDAAMVMEVTKQLAAPATSAQQEGLALAYWKLSRAFAAYQINGRSILDSRSANAVMLGLGLFSALLLGLAVYWDTIGRAEYDQPLYLTTRFYAGTFGPIVWGMLGACINLLKTISDKASDETFQFGKLRGLFVRIVIGGAFGWLIVKAFGIDSPGVTDSGVAFLAGLGAKVVYAAFEEILTVLHDRIAGKVPRPAAPSGTPHAAGTPQAPTNRQDQPAIEAPGPSLVTRP